MNQRQPKRYWRMTCFTEIKLISAAISTQEMFYPASYSNRHTGFEGYFSDGYQSSVSGQPTTIVHPNVKTLLYLSYGSSSPSYINVCDKVSGQRNTLIETSQGMNAVMFSPDGNMVTINTGTGVIQFLNSTSYKKTGEFDVRNSRDWISTDLLAYSPDGTILAFAVNDVYTGDHSIHLWDVKRHVELSILKGHTDRIVALKFRADSNALTSYSDDMTIRIWGISADNANSN
jgi:WD40 repeat protein